MVLPRIDGGRLIDWGRTADDYLRFRPGPPQSFYDRLRDVGVGIAGQHILDLATGTGALAARFAQAGCMACGLDVSVDMIRHARPEGVGQTGKVWFVAAQAEQMPCRTATFDVVTANQCWLYFDTGRTVSEVRRVLKPRGVLVTSHFSFMPRQDPIARASEQLVLCYNPSWTGADWDGTVPEQPAWSRGLATLRARICYDQPIWFTREQWRGRIRALRGIGASLPADEVAAFDQEHDALLKRMAPDRFLIAHRIDAHVLEFAD